MSRINIMYLRSNYPEEGGPESLILSWIEKLDFTKFGIILALLKDQDNKENLFLTKAKSMGIQTECLPWNKFNLYLPCILRIVALIKKNNIHILHTHDLRSNFVGYIAGKLTGISIITSAHGWIDKSLKVKIHNFVDTLIIGFFNRIIVNSEAMQKQISHLKFLDRKITIIENSVDTSMYNPNIDYGKTRKELGLNTENSVIVTVGRLNKEKGHRFLLEAAHDVIRAFPDAVFLIVGKGPLEVELKNMAKELGLSKNVIFTGFFKDLPKILKLMDIFVLPSVSEGVPVCLLEAMAAGKPVIATNVGGVPEIVHHEKTGLVIESRNVHGLAKAIILLLEDKEKAKELGEKGQAFINKRFSTEVMIQKIEGIYKELRGVSGRSSPK